MGDHPRVIVQLDAGLHGLPVAERSFVAIAEHQGGRNDRLADAGVGAGHEETAWHDGSLRDAASCSSRRRRSGSVTTMVNAASRAPATGGGGAVEKRNGRARCLRYSIAHDGPATNAPLTPRALPAVLMLTTASGSRLLASIRPLPRGP